MITSDQNSGKNVAAEDTDTAGVGYAMIKSPKTNFNE
jgi:hypothetical protein